MEVLSRMKGFVVVILLLGSKRDWVEFSDWGWGLDDIFGFLCFLSRDTGAPLTQPLKPILKRFVDNEIVYILNSAQRNE